MKKYIQRSLSLAAIIIFVVMTISYFCFDNSEETELLFSIIFLSFLIMGSHYLVLYLLGDWIILEIIVEYSLTEMIVLLTGIFQKWFVASNWWMSFVYITPVFIIVYTLEIIPLKTEIKEINEKLRERKNGNGDEQ